MQHSFISLNGKIVSALEPHFVVTNRALRYGDGLFEGMRIYKGEFLFFEDHIQRLLEGMRTLGFIVSSDFSSAWFFKLISELLHANKITGDAIIRIQVNRKGAGLYEPLNDEVEFFIETFDSSPYQWNEAGITVGVFDKWKKEFNPAMSYKTCNSQVYVMASRWKRDKKLDDALILNVNGNIADATSSNIFLWRESKLITPAISEAGIKGVIRKNLIVFAKQQDVTVEETIVSIADFKNADEVFLTNISKGIRSVKGCDEKIFNHSKTKLLTEQFYSWLLKRE